MIVAMVNSSVRSRKPRSKGKTKSSRKGPSQFKCRVKKLLGVGCCDSIFVAPPLRISNSQFARLLWNSARGRGNNCLWWGLVFALVVTQSGVPLSLVIQATARKSLAVFPMSRAQPVSELPSSTTIWIQVNKTRHCLFRSFS